MPPRKKRAKIGTPCGSGLVMRPNSVFSLRTKPEPGDPVAAAERVVEAAREAVAEVLDLAAEVLARELGRAWRKMPGRREEAVVARVVRDRRAERDRAPVVEEVGERQALEDADEAGRRPEERARRAVSTESHSTVPSAEAQPRLDERVAERQRSADDRRAKFGKT
jgi:hypothetical protein